MTSAIAYPAAIFALATAYRFNSIGGSSSGAGAAALAAAAEYRRRHGSSEGFRVLLERTAALAEKDTDGQTGLRCLFQPDAQHKRLFGALVPSIAKPSRKLRSLLLKLLVAYAGSAVVGFALAAAAVWLVSLCVGAQGGFAYLCAGLIGATMTLIWRVWRDVIRVVDHDYGMCSGMTRDRKPGTPAPLTEWLHDLIQEIAGRRRGDPPLSFADLAAAPGSPQETLGDLSKPDAGSIDLRVFTANLTHGRPYLLPQSEADPDPPLYFRPSELRRLFPDSVVDYLKSRPNCGRVDQAACIEPGRASRNPWLWPRPLPKHNSPADDDALWHLPRNDLPIVVAVRMSISFPVLFTAVPLWILDEQQNPPKYRRCMFSDGSLCSNFPIHLFDSPVPAWPTFGISLYEQSAHDKPTPLIYLPRSSEREGQQDRWNDFAEQPLPQDRLFGFVGAMLWTTKDWNDRTLARLPGVRERVVQVGLRSGTGGLNILMTSEEIRSLARLGADAARELLEGFSKPSRTSGMARGWDEHRWVRFNVLRGCLSRSLAGVTWSAALGRYAQPLREQIRGAVEAPPLEQHATSQLLAAQAAALEGVLAALTEAERAFAAPTFGQIYNPSPRPTLGVRPPL